MPAWGRCQSIPTLSRVSVLDPDTTIMEDGPVALWDEAIRSQGCGCSVGIMAKGSVVGTGKEQV